MGELPRQGMPGGGHGRLDVMLTSCGDTEGACSRLTCSASVSTRPTCSVSSALVTTVSGGMQGTCRTAGDSTLAGESRDSHRSGRVPQPLPIPTDSWSHRTKANEAAVPCPGALTSSACRASQ